jgi:hypothetical protein
MHLVVVTQGKTDSEQAGRQEGRQDWQAGWGKNDEGKPPTFYHHMASLCPC